MGQGKAGTLLLALGIIWILLVLLRLCAHLEKWFEVNLDSFGVRRTESFHEMSFQLQFNLRQFRVIDLTLAYPSYWYSLRGIVLGGSSVEGSCL